MNVIHQEPPKADFRAQSSVSADAAVQAPARKPWLWLGLAAAIAAGGYAYLNQPDPTPAAQPIAERLPPGQFRLAEGRIAYNDDRSTPMLSPFTGRVTRAFARVGDRVVAGQPLYEVETPDVTAAANEWLAALDNVQKTRVALEQARREETRQQSLFSARAASQRDVEQARAAAQGAEADVRSAAAQAEAQRDRLRVLGRDPGQIAEIERTRQVSGIITVTAPLAGTITQRRVGPGQWVSAGQGEPVFTIADLSTMWLVAQVREMDVPLIRVGQEVEVTLAALPGQVFPARIVRSAAGLDPATRRLTVMAEVADPEGALRPEMFANFRITVGAAQQSPAVPASAVIFRGSEANVWVALPEGRFILRRITPGIRMGDLIQAREGVEAGDRLVTGGALFIDRAARID